jgi:protocatechuate 3,4-dioxygenase beta subunit
MNGLKTVIFYLAGLAGLVLITVFFTRGIEPVEAIPPFMKTATALAARPTATPSATQIVETGCQTTPGGSASGYIPNTPLTTTLASPNLKGNRLVISGTVYASDCLTPLADALIEVWHTDAAGQYDREPPYTLRGQFRTDVNGRYEFSTIRPGRYNTGERPGPAHIHIRVSYREDEVLATRLMFADDPYLTHPSSRQQRLIVTLSEESGPDGSVLYGAFDIIMPVAPPAPTPSPTPDSQL